LPDARFLRFAQNDGAGWPRALVSADADALLGDPEIDVVVKAVVLGLGKAVGAIAIFYIGFTVNRWLEGWMERHPRWAKILKFLERFVRRTRWFGLTILLSIPLMSDTAVNYFYSLLNEEGHSISRWQFVLANLVGGVARAYLWLWLVPLAVG